MIDFYELLDDYMDGLLSPELKDQFELELKSNTSLQKAVENYPLAKKISQSMIELEAREHLKQLQSQNIKRFHYLRIAASIILLVGIGWAIKLSQDKLSPQETFALAYNTPPSSKTRGEAKFTSLDTAIMLFDEKQYEDAKKWFALIPKDNPNYSTSLLYLAHIAIQDKNYPLAESYFYQVTQSTDTNLQLEAQYNLMLLAILKNDISTAKKIFDTHFKNIKWIAKAKLEVLRVWVE